MGRKTSPRFSVVIPCYNEEAYLSKTLESLAKQDFKGSFEVIVVDNNCTDNTAIIARRYGAKVVFEKNIGVCWSRQAGLAAAKGEIIVSTDADTTADNNWLSLIDAAFKKDQELVAIGGACHYVNGPWWAELFPHLMFGYIYFVYKLTGQITYITATNTAFKKDYFEGYNTNLGQGADELGLLHAIQERGKFAFTNKYVVYTSSRRMRHGLWHSIFVSFGYYYLLAYHLNRKFGRQVIGNAPVYRRENVVRRRYGTAALGLFLLTGGLVFKTHGAVYARAQHYYHNFRNELKEK